MPGQLIVAIPALPAAERERIAAAAQNHGLEVRFFDSIAEAKQKARQAEIIFSFAAFSKEDAPLLRWQCTPSAGINQFLRSGAFDVPGAVLTHSSGAYGTTIAEHIVMVTLELMRRQAEYHELMQKREWRRDLPIRSIRGSRITLLGTGDIGQEAAIRLRAFSPASLTGINRGGRNPRDLFDRVLTMEHLNEILPETDLLILSLPETLETIRVMDSRRLALLPNDAFLVNVGRGSAIEQSALEQLLRSGHLAGAALDVFEQEPIPQDATIWTCPRLLITPHAAGNMTLAYTLQRIIDQFLEDLECFTAREPLRFRVDLSRGY